MKWVRILSFVDYKLNVSAAWLLHIICSFLGKSETYGRVRQKAMTWLHWCSWDLPQEEDQNWGKLCGSLKSYWESGAGQHSHLVADWGVRGIQCLGKEALDAAGKGGKGRLKRKGKKYIRQIISETAFRMDVQGRGTEMHLPQAKWKHGRVRKGAEPLM